MLERCLDAYDAGTLDANRPALDDTNGTPYAARIQVRVEKSRLPVRAGDRALRAMIPLRWARDFDGEHVLLTSAQRVRHLERALHERSLGRAEVLAVEPHVAVV